jgi:hypothetical protein
MKRHRALVGVQVGVLSGANALPLGYCLNFRSVQAFRISIVHLA